MFGLCQDRFTKSIYQLGFCLVPLADASIKPLEVLGRRKGELFRYGDLGDIFEAPGKDLPKTRDGIVVGLPDTSETLALDNRLGLHVMSQWLGGGAAGIKGKLNRTARFKMTLGGVTKSMTNIGELDSFLAFANLKGDSPAIEELMENDSLYIIIAVLKASSLDLETEAGVLTEADLKLPDVGHGVSGEAEVGVDGKTARKVKFNAKEPVVFAYQAARTFFHNGCYMALVPSRQQLHILDDTGDPILGQFPAENSGYLSDEVGMRFAGFKARGERAAPR
jgi:hypothetical protein